MGPVDKTAKAFRDGCAQLGITPTRFGRIARVDSRTVRRWANAERSFSGPPAALMDLLLQRPELLTLLPE